MAEKFIRLTLIGASVGKAWDLPAFPQRTGFHEYTFEYIGIYRFDKSEAVESILERTEDRPNGVILKECAAYFPSDIDFDSAKKLMMEWIDAIGEADSLPIPATIAPVTAMHDERFKTHNPFKRIVKRIIGISMMTRIERIIEYNDWIKEYADKKKLPLLDLEKALRMSDRNRLLRDELTKGDGLHLNEAAYRLLDDELIRTLSKAFPGGTDKSDRRQGSGE